MSPRKPINPLQLTLRTLVVLVAATLIGLGAYAAVDALPADTIGLESAEHGAEASGGQAQGGGHGPGRGAGRGGGGGGQGAGRFAASPEKAAAQATSDFLTIGAWILLAVGVEIVIVKLIKRHSAAQRAAVSAVPTSPAA